MSDAVTGDDPRCPWALGSPSMEDYHDTEWGFPVGSDVRLFEKLCLEAFQSGLSWRTILDKREGFRRAFAGFDPTAVATFGPDDVERLMGDASIVRNRAKIEAAIHYAGRYADLVEQEGSLAAFVWGFEPDPTEVPEPQTMSTSPSSTRLAKELKKRGWRFVGPTTAFAFMQSMGLVNDHVHGCPARATVADALAAFDRPGPPS